MGRTFLIPRGISSPASGLVVKKIQRDGEFLCGRGADLVDFSSLLFRQSGKPSGGIGLGVGR